MARISKSMTMIVIVLIISVLAACRADIPLPSRPRPGTVQADEVRLRSSELLMMESFPVQVVLEVAGELATPCHELMYSVSQDDERGRIDVSLWSQADQGANCIQVMAPFEETIRLGSFKEGSFQVYLNGQLVSTFTP